MQTHDSINISPIKLSAMEINLTQWFVYEWEKPTQQKPYQMILRLPLPRIYYYHNKQLQPIVEPLPQYPIGLVL